MKYNLLPSPVIFGHIKTAEREIHTDGCCAGFQDHQDRGKGMLMVVMATSERLQCDGGTHRLILSKSFLYVLVRSVKHTIQTVRQFFISSVVWIHF